MANNNVYTVVGARLWAVSAMAATMLVFGSGTPIRAQRVATTEARESRRITINVDRAPLTTVLRSIARQAGLVPLFNEALIPLSAQVSLHVREVAASEAFQQVLRGTGLVANVHVEGDVVIVRDANVAAVASGIIVGRVSDAKTKRPLRGAKIGIDSDERLVETADDGAYKIPNVHAGSHILVVKLLGYTKAIRPINVQDDASLTVDVALDPSATPLDQVVVTGTVIPTELKAVPNAITVITAKQIEERGITKIDQLFRGDVPGLFAQNQGSAPNAFLDEVTMFSRGTTALSSASGGTAFGTNPIKTYVDGVELADPKYLSQIDPKSIERIEILTGPQASTIYGSNAINGVMQIFTKRGNTSHPQLNVSLFNGWVENNFSNARTPQRDYSAQLNGTEGRLSYNVGGAWDYTAPWTPAKQSARTDGFGGARLDFPTAVGQITGDVILRRGVTQSLQRGDALQTWTGYRETGWYTPSSSSGLTAPTTRTLIGQTLGLTLSYAPTAWWSHELGVGQDASDTETLTTARGYLSVSDTTLLLRQDHTDRRSFRYTTTLRIPIGDIVQATVTTGADAWQNLTSSWQIQPQTLTGSLTGSTSIGRQPGHNAGGFLQSQVGITDRLFFTYGLRAEWNPNFGREAQPNYAPRYGGAYIQELGPVTAKLRGSYGRATRPPQATLKAAETIAQFYGPSIFAAYVEPYYNNYDYSIANPELSPEHQQGDEGGMELYLGTRGSLVVTRYNQTVDGLIASPVVDSVRSLVPCAGFACLSDFLDGNGYGYQHQYEYLNMGSIRNQGWELQGSINVGPLTTRGTYSWTKSRTIGVNQKYRAYFANQPQYTPGATFQYLPEHTWALGITYANAASNIGFNITGIGQTSTSNDDFFLQNLHGNIRLYQNRLNIFPHYTSFIPGYALTDLTAAHHFATQVEGVLQIQNLMNRYTNDFNAAYAALGRQTRIGIRWHS